MKPIVGLGMIGASLVLVYGGITGRLAPMLAALFYPSALKESSTSGGLNIPLLPIPGTIIPIPGTPSIHIP